MPHASSPSSPKPKFQPCNPPTATLSASSHAGHPTLWRWLTPSYPDQNPKAWPTNLLSHPSSCRWLYVPPPRSAQSPYTQTEVPRRLEVFNVSAYISKWKELPLTIKVIGGSQHRCLIPGIAGSSGFCPISWSSWIQHISLLACL